MKPRVAVTILLLLRDGPGERPALCPSSQACDDRAAEETDVRHRRIRTRRGAARIRTDRKSAAGVGLAVLAGARTEASTERPAEVRDVTEPHRRGEGTDRDVSHRSA